MSRCSSPVDLALLPFPSRINPPRLGSSSHNQVRSLAKVAAICDIIREESAEFIYIRNTTKKMSSIENVMAVLVHKFPIGDNPLAGTHEHRQLASAIAQLLERYSGDIGQIDFEEEKLDC